MNQLPPNHNEYLHKQYRNTSQTHTDEVVHEDGQTPPPPRRRRRSVSATPVQSAYRQQEYDYGQSIGSQQQSHNDTQQHESPGRRSANSSQAQHSSNSQEYDYNPYARQSQPEEHGDAHYYQPPIGHSANPSQAPHSYNPQEHDCDPYTQHSLQEDLYGHSQQSQQPRRGLRHDGTSQPQYRRQPSRARRALGRFLWRLSRFSVISLAVVVAFSWWNPLNLSWCNEIQASVSTLIGGFIKEESSVSYDAHGNARMEMKGRRAKASITVNYGEKRYVYITQAADSNQTYSLDFSDVLDITLQNASGEILLSKSVNSIEFEIAPTGRAEQFTLTISADGMFAFSPEDPEYATAIISPFVEEQRTGGASHWLAELPLFASAEAAALAVSVQASIDVQPQPRTDGAPGYVTSILRQIERAYNNENMGMFLKMVDPGSRSEKFTVAGLSPTASERVLRASYSVANTLSDGTIHHDSLDKVFLAYVIFDEKDYLEYTFNAKDTRLSLAFDSHRLVTDTRMNVSFIASLVDGNGTTLKESDNVLVSMALIKKSRTERVPILGTMLEGWYIDDISPVTDTKSATNVYEITELSSYVVEKVDRMLLASFADAAYSRDLYGLPEKEGGHYVSIGGVNGPYRKWRLVYSHQKNGGWLSRQNEDGQEGVVKVTDLLYLVFERGDTIVIAFRGTPPPFPLPENASAIHNWVETIGLIVSGEHYHDSMVYQEVTSGKIRELVKKGSGKKVYITGHSLGGHLALLAYSYIIRDDTLDANLIEQVQVFNALGIKEDDASLVQRSGYSERIVLNYTCCDIATLTSQFCGLSYVGAHNVKQETKNAKGETHNHITDKARAEWRELVESVLLASYTQVNPVAVTALAASPRVMVYWTMRLKELAQNIVFPGFEMHGLRKFPWLPVMLDESPHELTIDSTVDINNWLHVRGDRDIPVYSSPKLHTQVGLFYSGSSIWVECRLDMSNGVSVAETGMAFGRQYCYVRAEDLVWPES